MTRRPLAVVAVAVVLAAACSPAAGVVTERAETSSDRAGRPADPPPVTASPRTDPPGTDSPSATSPSGTESGSGSGPGNGPASPADDPFGWTEYSDGVETGLLEVPIDYDDPDGPTFELFVARHPATDEDARIGSLLVNPGGPGFGGSDFAIFADRIFGEALLERFDIIGWDPRGTGLSEPAIDCISDYDRFFAEPDITPDDAAERQLLVDLAEEFADACVERNGEFLEHVGTNNSARDIDAIRRALGEEQISYFGFSYGSELGATWATMFPTTVRAAVLDGASSPNAAALDRSLQQIAGFEQALDTYLAQCSADSSCAFHNGGDAAGAFDALMLELDENPVPSEPGRPDVNRGVALHGVLQAMYSETFWDWLSESLAAAQEGDGGGLLALYDAYFQRNDESGEWGNELEAFQSIRCMDSPDRPTVAEEDATVARFQEVAPRAAPHTTGSYSCTFFPPSTDPRIEITGAGAGPVVVIGTTGDAATPLQGTREMAATLEDGRLVVVTADQHTGYRVNDCVDDIVHAYLIDLVVPPAESQC